MINPQLLDFIRKEKINNKTREQIESELFSNGWNKEDVEEGFNRIGIPTPGSSEIPTASYFSFNASSNTLKVKKHLLSIILKISLFLVYIFCFIFYFLYIFDLHTLRYFLFFNQYNSFETFLFVGIFISFLISLLFLYLTLRTFYLKKKMAFFWLIVFILLNILGGVFIYGFKGHYYMAAKPVIYLYPTSTEKIKVQLDYKGTIVADYPSYDTKQKGWTVTAFPDGKIIGVDGKEYSYLFWEGKPSIPIGYDLSTGFVVRGEDTMEFLQNTLSKMGLTPKEYNEFIVYWYPKMKDNKYNLIHFAGDEYTNTAPLAITPKPDSMLRVFMVFKPFDIMTNIKSQEIKPFVRNGFTVVEWGGTELGK